MTNASDMDLLREFGRNQSEAAFTELVRRHLNLVYSIARRCTDSDGDAQDVTQAVFVILARKAASMRARTALTGWLYETARHTAARARRTNARRHIREQEAYVQSTLTAANTADDWRRLVPHLEAAMSQLGEGDRALLALRFYENKSGLEAAALLGIREAAAHKRTARALEKLRRFFTRRGVALSAAAIAGAISANSVQAAPAALAASISAAATAKGAAAGASTLALVKGALKTLAWARYKPIIGLGIATAATGGLLATAVARYHHRGPEKALVAPVETARETLTGTACISLDSPPGGLSVLPDGKIVVGASLFGSFIDPESGNLGYFERGVMRLNADGSFDRDFCCRAAFPASDSARAHIDPLPGGGLLVSGLFDSVEGQPRPGYAKLLADGRVDESFVPASNSAGSNGPVLGRTYLPGGTYPAAALGDGSVAVMTADPLTVFRLDATGKLITAATNISPLFPPHAGLVFTLKNEGFWGNWHGHEPIDWTNTTPAKRRPLARPPGQLPFEDCAGRPTAADAAAVFQALFAEVPLALCRVAAPLPASGALLAVQDAFINGSLVAPGRLMRFDKDWRPDFSFTNRYEFDRRGCMTLRLQQDGKLLVAGGFVKLNGGDFSGLARLNPNGDTDPGFHCAVSGPDYGRLVMDAAVQGDGKILICGAFTSVNGVKRQHLARLNPDGSLDDSFKSPFMSLEELQARRRLPVFHLAGGPQPAAANAANAADPAAPAPAVVPEETILITSIECQNGAAAIRFTGSPQKTYILQAKTSLDAADWSNVATNLSTAAGEGTFRDPDAGKFPTRFYRIASP